MIAMSKLEAFKRLSASAAYIAVFLFAVTNINPGGPNVTVQNETVDVTTERPTYNLSCPKPEIRPNVTVKNFPSNIQNAEYDQNVQFGDGFVRINDVDVAGQLYGSSMSPSIMNEDVVVSKDFSGQSLQEGMIIRYKKDNRTMIHRIVGDYQSQGYVVASGDRTDEMEKVKLEEITHVVKAVIYN